MDNVLYSNSTEKFRGELNFELVGVIPPYNEPLQRNIDVNKKRIVVVACDFGGYNATLPALKLAQETGYRVDILCFGTCELKFNAENLVISQGISILTDINVLTVEGVFGPNPNIDLLVICASTSDEGRESARVAIRRAPTSCPIMVVEDMYGSADTIISDWIPTVISSICVIDEFARQLICLKHSELRDAITVTGGPQFDRVIEMKKTWDEDRTRLLKAMGVKGHVIFLVVGGLEGTVDMLRLIQAGLGLTGLLDHARLVCRPHPRASTKDKAELAHYLATPQPDWFIEVPAKMAQTSDDLLPVADLVVTPFSTTGHFAILHQILGTIYVGTKTIQDYHNSEKGYYTPPEVEAGVAWYATDASEMAEAIEETLRPGIRARGIINGQLKMAEFNDGKSGERVFAEMQKLMTQ